HTISDIATGQTTIRTEPRIRPVEHTHDEIHGDLGRQNLHEFATINSLLDNPQQNLFITNPRVNRFGIDILINNRRTGTLPEIDVQIRVMPLKYIHHHPHSMPKPIS